MLSSLRSRKKSDHSAVKFRYELNFRHSRFLFYLFTIHSQGLLHFTPHRIHFNHDSRNRFLSHHGSQNTKKPDHGVTKIPLPPLYEYFHPKTKWIILKSIMQGSCRLNLSFIALILKLERIFVKLQSVYKNAITENVWSRSHNCEFLSYKWLDPKTEW